MSKDITLTFWYIRVHVDQTRKNTIQHNTMSLLSVFLYELILKHLQFLHNFATCSGVKIVAMATDDLQHIFLKTSKTQK